MVRVVVCVKDDGGGGVRPYIRCGCAFRSLQRFGLCHRFSSSLGGQVCKVVLTELTEGTTPPKKKGNRGRSWLVRPVVIANTE